MAKINVILYCRVSTDEQAARGQSLQYQERRLRDFCEMMGYNIKAVFIEDCSAKTFKRPEWEKLISFIKANKGLINKLLFLKWDRFSRNTEDALTMIRKLKAYGVEANAVEQVLDFEIPENKFMRAFYLTAPEVENDKISSRTREGLHQAKLNGCWPAKAPYGYDNFRLSSKLSSLKPNQSAAIVKELFDLMLTGVYSINELRRKLKPKGFT
jgi:site-specific DNA recombinase